MLLTINISYNIKYFVKELDTYTLLFIFNIPLSWLLNSFLRLYATTIHVAISLTPQLGADVFNSLDVMDNKSVLEDLKFGQGDGNLHYYFYNFKCPELTPEKVCMHMHVSTVLT